MMMWLEKGFMLAWVLGTLAGAAVVGRMMWEDLDFKESVVFSIGKFVFGMGIGLVLSAAVSGVLFAWPGMKINEMRERAEGKSAKESMTTSAPAQAPVSLNSTGVDKTMTFGGVLPSVNSPEPVISTAESAVAAP